MQYWRSYCGWRDTRYRSVAVYMGMARALPVPRNLFATLHSSVAAYVSINDPDPTITSLLTQFSPESPRWLVHQGYYEEARISVAQTNADGNLSNPVVVAIFKEIVDTLKSEKENSIDMSPVEIFRNPTARRRLLIGMSAGPFSCIAGNIIASYYFGSELDTAGITDTNDQLKAVILSPDRTP